MSTDAIWGIDLGGTKIEAAIIDRANPSRALWRERIATEAAQGYSHVIAQIARLISRLESQSGLSRPGRIGIGTPGNSNPADGLLYHANSQCLNGQPFRADLAAALGIDVVMANDANCFALAEARYGAGKAYETVMGLIIGTGAGGGLVVNGELVNGRHGIAGEWGQIVLDSSPDAPLSVYGTRGTIESFIAGPSLENCYERLTGQRRPLREIVDLAEAGSDPAAAATMEQLVERFAQGVSILINLFDPHAIVIGGGVSNLDLLYTPRVRGKLQTHVFQQHFTTPLLRAELGDSAGVFGAAMLVG